MEQRNSDIDEKGKAQAGEAPVRSNTDAMHEGRLSRSSEEAPVMGVEQRAEVIQLTLPMSTSGKRGRNMGGETKTIPITLEMVQSAYHKVRKNRGAAGVDKESLAKFEENLADNLYITWNRLSSGSYHPTNVREVAISKDDGRKRYLGIPTVRDRISQQVVKDYLENRFEALFSEHSYGFRPLKNTHQALTAVRKNVRKYEWVIDMDISGFFDNMSHGLLMKAIERHVPEKWIKMYISRWLESPIENAKGKVKSRGKKGTPQGGVISPLLSNLFLHYTFDKWFEINFPELRFVRYADDIIVHCRNQQEAEQLLETIKQRFIACELELNDRKTRVVHCKDANRKTCFKTVRFDFLGFSFQPRPALNKKERVLFLGFDCAISRKSEKKISEKVRSSKFHEWTNSSIYDIAYHFNPLIRGWINYYGAFRKRELQRIFNIFHKRLIKWVCKRYKRMNGSRRKAWFWIMRIANQQPNLFEHWRHGFQTA